MKRRAYFFDWMGTLADVSEREEAQDFLGEKMHSDLLVKKFEEVKMSEKERERIRNKLTSVEHYLYEDSLGVITNLKPHYKLAIISNVYDITARKIRQLFPDFLEKFDVVTFSPEVGLIKPDPEIFRYTLNELNRKNGGNIRFEEAIMIGDKEKQDMNPALKLGMQAKLISRISQKLRDVI